MNVVFQHIVGELAAGVDNGKPGSALSPLGHLRVYQRHDRYFIGIITTLRNVEPINMRFGHCIVHNVEHTLERADRLRSRVVIVVYVVRAHMHCYLLGRNELKEGFGEVFPVVGSRSADAGNNCVLTCVGLVEVGPEPALVEERVSDEQRGFSVVTHIIIGGKLSCNTVVVICGNVVARIALVYGFSLDLKSVGKMLALCQNLEFAGFERGHRLFIGVDSERGCVVLEGERLGIIGFTESEIQLGRGIAHPGDHVFHRQSAVVDKRGYRESCFVMLGSCGDDYRFSAYQHVNATVHDLDVVALERVFNGLCKIGIGEGILDRNAFCPFHCAFDVVYRQRAVVVLSGHGEGCLNMLGSRGNHDYLSSLQCLYLSVFYLDCVALECVSNLFRSIRFGENGVYRLFFTHGKVNVLHRESAVVDKRGYRESCFVMFGFCGNGYGYSAQKRFDDSVFNLDVVALEGVRYLLGFGRVGEHGVQLRFGAFYKRYVFNRESAELLFRLLEARRERERQRKRKHYRYNYR